MARATRLAVLALALSTGLASASAVACSNGPSSPPPQVTIGVDLPISGGDASDGITTLNGIRFAVDQQNLTGGIGGMKVKLVVRDDTDPALGIHSPQQGVRDIQQLAGTHDVLAVLGPYNSNVAAAEIPVANQANLALVSPVNTDPCLTREIPGCPYDAKKLRPNGVNNYFRIPATDDHAASAMADYILHTVHLNSVAVVSDGQSYGKGIAHRFADAFRAAGGQITSTQDTNTEQMQSFESLVKKFKSEGARAVYFGGVASSKGCVLRAQMKGTFDANSTPFLGGDGILDAPCLDDAGAQNVNMMATLGSPDPTSYPGASSTVSAFKNSFPKASEFGAHTMQGFASAKVLMAAIAKAMSANHGKLPSRRQVIDALGRVSEPTPAGQIRFDANGDPVQQAVSIYNVSLTPRQSGTLVCGNQNSGACWVFLKTVTYSAS